MPKTRLLIFFAGIFIIIFIILLVFGVIPGLKGGKPPKITLEFWGVFDDSEVYTPLITSFQMQNPGVTINYRKKSVETYEKELIDALAAGNGPDIFAVNNYWLPRYYNKISPAPQTTINLIDFYNTFVDVAYKDLVVDKKILGIPLFVDTLALYWNRDLLNSVGIPAEPKTWEDFQAESKKLTVKDESGNIIRSGAALGTAKNVNRAVDILYLLMMQLGAQMTNDDLTQVVFDKDVTVDGRKYNPGQAALQFYTDFGNYFSKYNSWNSKMPYSIDAFVEAKAAMMIGYSYHLPVILSKAPHLNFLISPMLQPQNAKEPINFASYWPLTVSVSSKHSQKAWEFILHMSNPENNKIYLTNVRKPTARRDLVFWQRADYLMGIFANQSLTATSWFQKDNLLIEDVFNDIIEKTSLGRIRPEDAIKQALQKVNEIMR